MNGTKPTKDIKSPGQAKSLDLDQISGIIKACAEHKVAVLKFGDLKIWFGPHAKPEVIPETPVLPTSRSVVHPEKFPVAEMTDKQHEEQTQRAIELNELEIREQQIAELLVTDPEKAEELMRQGELQDADDEHGDVE